MFDLLKLIATTLFNKCQCFVCFGHFSIKNMKGVIGFLYQIHTTTTNACYLSLCKVFCSHVHKELHLIRLCTLLLPHFQTLAITME